MTFAPSEDSDQPGHPPSLIRVFAVCLKKHWVLSYPLSALQRLIRLRGCHADLSLRWVHMPYCWFCHEAAQITSFFIRENYDLKSKHLQIYTYMQECMFYMSMHFNGGFNNRTIEPGHSKTYKMVCTQQSLRSACASAQSVGDLLIAKHPRIARVDSGRL